MAHTRHAQDTEQFSCPAWHRKELWQSSHMAKFAFMLISAGVCRACEPLIQCRSWEQEEVVAAAGVTRASF